MRKDFAKLLVERERVGGDGNRKGRQPRDPDDLPRKQGMRKAHRDRKTFNENLAPLKRFLNSQVGRPWNKVYSELCEHISLDNTVQRHILEHLFWYVERHVHTEGKKVFRKEAHYGHYSELWDKALYVDPKSGILRRYKRQEKIGPKQAYRDDFHTDFNRLLSGSKSQTVLHDNTFWKVYQNPGTGEWDLFNKANETHARIDFNHIATNFYKREDLNWFFRRHWKKISGHGSPYIKTFIALYQEWVERTAKEKAAAERLKNAKKREAEERQKAANLYYKGVFN